MKSHNRKKKRQLEPMKSHNRKTRLNSPESLTRSTAASRVTTIGSVILDRLFVFIPRFAASDEDASQSLSFSLTNDDSGRFKVDPQGKLYKAKAVDYETQQRHVIKAMVQDNGNPAMKVTN